MPSEHKDLPATTRLGLDGRILMKDVDTNEGRVRLIAWPIEEGGRYVLPCVGYSDLAKEYFEVRKQYYGFYPDGSIRKPDGCKVNPQTVSDEELEALPDEARAFVMGFMRGSR